MLIECPHCLVQVSPSDEGHCSLCQRKIAESSTGSSDDAIELEDSCLAPLIPLPQDSPPHETDDPDSVEIVCLPESEWESSNGEPPIDGTIEENNSRPIVYSNLLQALGICFGLFVLESIVFFQLGIALPTDENLSAAFSFTVSGLTIAGRNKLGSFIF